MDFDTTLAAATGGGAAGVSAASFRAQPARIRAASGRMKDGASEDFWSLGTGISLQVVMGILRFGRQLHMNRAGHCRGLMRKGMGYPFWERMSPKRNIRGSSTMPTHMEIVLQAAAFAAEKHRLLKRKDVE